MDPVTGGRIEGAGTADADWQEWPGLAALPPITAEQLVPHGARAVIVAPHPDDELLGCGGLLQLLAEAQREMVLVAVTDGGASHPDSTLWPAERLLETRPRESLQALALLGLAQMPIRRAGLPDGEVSSHAGALRVMLEHLLRPGDVVFATWRLDGHPDHEATGRCAAEAVARCGARLVELPIWGWHWARPGDARLPWQRARRLDLSQAQLARKRLAIASYSSQLEADPSTGRPPILPAGALERLLHPYEIYFT